MFYSMYRHTANSSLVRISDVCNKKKEVTKDLSVAERHIFCVSLSTHAINVKN